MSVVLADGLRKEFVVWAKAGRFRRSRRTVAAVDGVDLRIEPGEMVGYLGPNGAGKSTTLKMLTGILTPSGGSVRVCGLNPVPDRTRLARRMGAVFGQRSQLWWDLPLSESFALLRSVYRVSSGPHGRRLRECVELLEMGPFLATPVRQLSLGQRMRGELTAALLHDPELLFLDEPTIGLDVVSKEAVRGFLAELNQRHGTTLVLTTHDLADIERLCDRLVVIDRGRVVHDGTLAALHERYGSRRRLVVELDGPCAPLAVAGASTELVEADGRRQTLALDGPLPAVVAAVAAAAPLRDLRVLEPAIEDVIRKLWVG
ncbi:ABC transporter ATP-binding protein [Cryptosporangium aurantiacum]|uniref:ABC-2 type transport system ATP-binding protein n=1 Tax=Cryptosporangium aurantiacum TaxID=134849 RepID=A0A1M7R7P6_9ACTN|nr:ATP-binding cassette domain-containing protein [Cryptosporangium aurantiacum]SHN42324.1 ABC-2 type transport system ATP-binding protein [Cryptosporangium aurantiacum]